MTSTNTTNSSTNTERLIEIISSTVANMAYDHPYENTADIVAEILAGSILFAKRNSIDWAAVQNSAKALTKSPKVAKPSIKPEVVAGDMYRHTLTSPTGETVTDETPAPYEFAIFQRKAGVWAIRSRVNTKTVAHSRCHTFKKAGVLAEDLAIVAVEGIFAYGPGEDVDSAPVARPEPVVKAPKAAKAPKAERKPKAAKTPEAEPVVEAEGESQAERNARILEAEQVAEPSMNFAYTGSEKIHMPSKDYTGALCGYGKGKEPRQVEGEATCKNCQRVVVMLAEAERLRSERQEAERLAAEAAQAEAEASQVAE